MAQGGDGRRDNDSRAEKMREVIEVSTLWVNSDNPKSIFKGKVIMHKVEHEKDMEAWPPSMPLIDLLWQEAFGVCLMSEES